MSSLVLTTLLGVLVAMPVAASPEITQPPQQLADAGVHPHFEIPEPDETARAYHRAAPWLLAANYVQNMAILALILFSGLSARLRRWARMAGRTRLATIALYVLLFGIVATLLRLPLAYYEGFVRPHAYDLTSQTLGRWLEVSFVDFAIGFLRYGFVACVLFSLIRVSPRRWWLYGGALVLPYTLFSAYIVPISVTPLFWDHHAMQDQALEAQITRLGERAGIDELQVYEARISVDSDSVNAWVAGLGNTRQVVLGDNVREKLDTPAVLFIVAHEMGHYVLHHLVHSILLSSVMLFASFYLIYRLAAICLLHLPRSLGIHRLDDVASLPLLLLLLGLLTPVVDGAMAAMSRRSEFEADRFALELTQDPRTAGAVFLELQASDLLNPRPDWFSMIWTSHPPLAQRIELVNEYHPWTRGDPLAYGHLFRSEGDE